MVSKRMRAGEPMTIAMSKRLTKKWTRAAKGDATP
jgi:hypothetical protein